jgi:hypothetical protein
VTSWVPVIAALVGAVLTAVVGNRLVAHWQQRNWRHQQRISGLEREYLAMLELTTELGECCGERLAAMRSLHAALKRASYAEELASYQCVLEKWNGKLHNWYAQLTFQFAWDKAQDLERRVHSSFVNAGALIEKEIRSQRAPSSLPDRGRLARISEKLDSAAGEISEFTRTISRECEERREEVYYGQKIKYNLRNIVLFTNLELIKLLFVSDIDNFSVVRPSADALVPLGRRL